jgi:fructose-specific phosphotransferase system IIC component
MFPHPNLRGILILPVLGTFVFLFVFPFLLNPSTLDTRLSTPT